MKKLIFLIPFAIAAAIYLFFVFAEWSFNAQTWGTDRGLCAMLMGFLFIVSAAICGIFYSEDL